MDPKSPQSLSGGLKHPIALGIAGSIVTRDHKQKHLSLIHRDANNGIMLLHLAWHHKLCYEPWDSKYHWMEFSGIDDTLQEVFADWAVLVAGAAPQQPIPYSVIFSPSKNFDKTGQFITRKDGSGLTCATFILALFSDFNLPLIDTKNWPNSRPGDFSWTRKILRFLRKHVPISLPKIDWLEQVKQRHNLKRFRPEEVFATASIFSGSPLDFPSVEKESRRITPLIPN